MEYKLISIQLVKQLPAFYENRKSISMLKRTPKFILILSHMNPTHHFLWYSFKIHFNIILPSKPGFLSRSFLTNFPTQILYSVFYIIFSSPFRVTWSTHSILHKCHMARSSSIYVTWPTHPPYVLHDPFILHTYYMVHSFSIRVTWPTHLIFHTCHMTHSSYPPYISLGPLI
jgi:hypothetical protein